MTDTMLLPNWSWVTPFTTIAPVGNDTPRLPVTAKGRKKLRLVGRSPNPLPNQISGLQRVKGSAPTLALPVWPHSKPTPSVSMNSCSALVKSSYLNVVSKFCHPFARGLLRCVNVSPIEMEKSGVILFSHSPEKSYCTDPSGFVI